MSKGTHLSHGGAEKPIFKNEVTSIIPLTIFLLKKSLADKQIDGV